MDNELTDRIYMEKVSVYIMQDIYHSQCHPADPKTGPHHRLQ